jgi:Asp/Glu/hydantoin racemase
VVGLTEAALAGACLLGQRFSIIAISQRIQAWYRDVVQANGLSGRLSSIRALDRPLSSPGSVQSEHAQALLTLCHQAAREDGAEVLILAGAPLAGLARSLEGRLPVPVVDGVSSAVQMALALAALQPFKAGRMGGSGKPHAGLPPGIVRLLEGGASTA